MTTFDVVLIRKVILYVNDAFPNNNSWRFIKADYLAALDDDSAPKALAPKAVGTQPGGAVAGGNQ